MYEKLIAELRQHHCDAREDDTQEVCEECAYDVIIADKSVPSGISSVCVCGLMNRAADAIEVLSKMEKTTHWIPVTERLPEENGRYLVRYVRDIDLEGGVHSDEVRTMRFVDAQWRFPFICNPDVRKFVTREKVTHWMPLPEPPKEET